MITLHRSKTVALNLVSNSKEPGTARAFVFDVEIALAKYASGGLQAGDEDIVDRDSGMVVNLVQVDALLSQLSEFWQREGSSPSMQEVLIQSLKVLNAALANLSFNEKSNQKTVPVPSVRGVFLQRICFYEKRGTYFGWEEDFFCGRKTILETPNGVKHFEGTFAFQEDVPELGVTENKDIFTVLPTLQRLRIENYTTNEISIQSR